MNGGSSDASTSTDDVKARPLCLFYFTHPFGVLSPEPPRLAAPPWGPAPHATPWGAAPCAAPWGPIPTCPESSSRALELGALRRASLSSSLLSSDVWFTSGSSCRSSEYARRVLPYSRTLPPLRVSGPLECRPPEPAGPLWSSEWFHPEKFSLPPLEARGASACGAGGAARGGGALCGGRVRKPRRVASVRRALAALMRRTLAGHTAGGGAGSSPALRAALFTVRRAWHTHAPPTLTTETPRGDMRRDASPGLLRRRYSAPETVMRRYRLAQQSSDSERSAPPSAPLPRAAPRPCCCVAPRPHSASPRRQRLDAAMLRAAMRNSFERAAHRAPQTPPRDPLTDSDTPKCPPRSSTEASPLVLAAPRTLSPSPATAGGDHSYTDHSSPYDEPLTVDTVPSYEVLEIVVSETLTASPASTVAAPAADELPPDAVKATPDWRRSARIINIDEYVSNILVESLNSLTDQLECMNASIPTDKKINIVEKEIKVKLQNTGVNTIVHLSPTSNNQIIFGNEELCNEECNNNSLTIREETHSLEENNNVAVTSTPPPHGDTFDIHHDTVNQAVLQQIQRLFHEQLHNLSVPDVSLPDPPETCHEETSSVDVYLAAAALGAVGAGNYFPDLNHNPVVPRFSALPHTDSMEVNTSSSDDADFIGSDCTSLVDSLDDPNSPRSVSVRRAYRRGELVRSAIDVLDLLPENVHQEETSPLRDKPESFFIGITDNECDCDKENVNVADRMPEKIKQRLYRRHRRREQRMECARRTRSGRDATRPRARLAARRQLERECSATLGALVDDVIAAVALDEYKGMRIKRRPATRVPHSKSEESVASTRRSRRNSLETADPREPFKAIKSDSARCDTKEKHERHQVYGKLSLRPSAAMNDRAAKRIYQKSEIHDGNKCIEILEIFEYVNGSQSSSDAPNTEENQNSCTKNKKSRIPVLIPERSQRTLGADNNKKRPGSISHGTESNGNTNRLIANMLLEALAEHDRAPASRRGSVPAPQPRSHAGSQRFRQTFDIIPEERSLSLESGPDDAASWRRASAPDIVDEYREHSERECDAVPAPPTAHSPPGAPQHRVKQTLSVATSPMSERGGDKRSLQLKHQTTMTSPSSKSAATSPARPAPGTKCVASPTRSSLSTQGRVSRSLSCDQVAGATPHRRRTRGRGAAHSPAPHSGSSSDSAAPHRAGSTQTRRAPSDGAGWSVRVAGSCGAAPRDLELRVRFPPAHTHTQQERVCGARSCACAPPPAPPRCEGEEGEGEGLPALHPRRTAQARRGEGSLRRTREALAVRGSAVVPELRPPVPSMSQRDLTRGPGSSQRDLTRGPGSSQRYMARAHSTSQRDAAWGQPRPRAYSLTRREVTRCLQVAPPTTQIYHIN